MAATDASKSMVSTLRIQGVLNSIDELLLSYTLSSS